MYEVQEENSVVTSIYRNGKRGLDITRLPREYHDYAPYGACRDLFRNKVPELIISGPAGTGKSRACLEKIHWILDKYRGIRALMIRKTRRSMTQSCIVTYEQEVLPHPDYVPFHGGDQEYRYPNRSIFAIAGLDDPQKIYSSQWDIIYVNQCEELTEEEWVQVKSRVRNFKMPYQQLLGDCNPAHPKHWILSRRASGFCTILESRHEDNPVYWDRAKNDWTEKGRTYVLGTLDSLFGALKQRLRYGKWAAAEGAVYEESWDRAHHVIPRFFKTPEGAQTPLTEDQVPKDWPRIWSIDFGYKNPFVWGAWAKDPDGRLYLYKQIYMTNRIVSDHAKTIKEVTKNDPKPIAIICDTDAEDRASFERELGWQTKGAWKKVSAGLQGVEARLRKDALGKARLFYLENSLIETDQSLLAAKKPVCTEDEYELYIWEMSSGRRKGEEPKKENDHGQDMTRYLVAYVDELNKRTIPMFHMGSITKSGSGGNDAGYGMTRPSGFRMPSNAPNRFGGR
jgi:Phage terminase large subunit